MDSQNNLGWNVKSTINLVAGSNFKGCPSGVKDPKCFSSQVLSIILLKHTEHQKVHSLFKATCWWKSIERDKELARLCLSSSWIYKILATNDLLLLTARNKPILKIQNGKHKIWKRSIKLDHTIFYLHFAAVMFLAGHHGNGKVWGKLTTAKLIAEVHKRYI